MQKIIETLFEKDIHLDDLPCGSETLEQGSKTVENYAQLLHLLGNDGKKYLEEFICNQLTVSCAQKKQAFTEGYFDATAECWKCWRSSTKGALILQSQAVIIVKRIANIGGYGSGGTTITERNWANAG